MSISPSLLNQSIAHVCTFQKFIQFSQGLTSQECQEPCCGLWEDATKSHLIQIMGF